MAEIDWATKRWLSRTCCFSVFFDFLFFLDMFFSFLGWGGGGQIQMERAERRCQKKRCLEVISYIIHIPLLLWAHIVVPLMMDHGPFKGQSYNMECVDFGKEDLKVTKVSICSLGHDSEGYWVAKVECRAGIMSICGDPQDVIRYVSIAYIYEIINCI